MTNQKLNVDLLNIDLLAELPFYNQLNIIKH